MNVSYGLEEITNEKDTEEKAFSLWLCESLIDIHKVVCQTTVTIIVVYFA